jgi:hypothetical protein
VTADVPTGLLVFHESVTLHELAPEAIVHEGDVGVSVPDGGTRQMLPSQVVPAVQLALAVRETSS